MKLSLFNILKEIDNVTIFFNAKTCALAVVDNNFMQVISDIRNNSYNESKYNSKLIEDMKKAGCIVSDESDELKELEYYRNLGKYDLTFLALTIAPTLDCNFRCKYCFETHRHGVMSISNRVALINFVKKRISQLKHLSINWYGGEPLIAKNVIYSLSEKFISLCKVHEVEYSAFIITNASLLKDEDILSFKKYNIRGAQITIDGPKEMHDARRVNCAGGSTFELLLENVNKLLLNDIDVIIRINIDKENIDTVNDLLAILKNKIIKPEKVKIDFGKVTALTEVCKSVENECFNGGEYADLLLPLYAKAISYGFVMNRMAVYPSPRFNYCTADYANSFVIDVDGDIHKCWNHVGNKNQSCGNLQNNDMELSSKYLEWVQWDPFRIEKCKNCNLLPVCMGGCPDTARQNNNIPVCDSIKFNIDKVIDFYYKQLGRGINEVSNKTNECS